MKLRISSVGWVARAREMQALGHSYSQIAKALNVHKNSVAYQLSPNGKANSAKRKKRFSTEKSDRALELQRRAQLRYNARKEAAETGEPAQTIYERWGVLSPLDDIPSPELLVGCGLPRRMQIAVVAVLRDHGLAWADVMARGRRNVAARMLVWREMARCGWSATRIANHFGRDHTTVGYALGRFKKKPVAIASVHAVNSDA